MNIELDILRYVKEHKIPMVKVAQAAGMTPQNIKKSIGNNPKGDTITKIANGLGVHPSVFFYDKDEDKATTGFDEDFKKTMEGIYSTCVGVGTLDESPMAYKDTNEILELIKPTCDVLFMVKPKINIKAMDSTEE